MLRSLLRCYWLSQNADKAPSAGIEWKLCDAEIALSARCTNWNLERFYFPYRVALAVAKANGTARLYKVKITI